MRLQPISGSLRFAQPQSLSMDRRVGTATATCKSLRTGTVSQSLLHQRRLAQGLAHGVTYQCPLRPWVELTEEDRCGFGLFLVLSTLCGTDPYPLPGTALSGLSNYKCIPAAFLISLQCLCVTLSFSLFFLKQGLTESLNFPGWAGTCSLSAAASAVLRVCIGPGSV